MVSFILGMIVGVLIGAILGFVTFARILNDGLKSIGAELDITIQEKEKITDNKLEGEDDG
mgnify:CR=1 FL=1